MTARERRARRRPLLIAGGAALITALAGGSITKIDGWYRALEKSSLNPPDWVFGPAWALIYALAVISATIGWRTMKSSAERAWLLSLFFVNAVLNVAWSGVFFTLRRPDWAMGELIALWISVACLIVFLGRRSRMAGALLVPYLGWVSLAGWLNYKVVALNGPFGGS
ncbi:MAG: TspO/MBR family protein [Hyphomonas sp.]